MESIERLWRSIADRQYAVITTGQLLTAGLSRRQIDRRVAAGVLAPVHRGVYRLGGAPQSWHQAVMAACLASSGVASHRSAAALWGFRGCEPGVVEVTVPGRRSSDLAGVLCHTSEKLEMSDTTERAGLPVTTPARTLLDLGAVVRRHAVERALEGAIHRELVTPAELRATLHRAGARGRDGTGVLRDLLRDRSPDQAATESPLEDDLVRLLRRANLPEPVRQHVVRLPGGRTVRLDLAYPDRKVAIEAQGFVWHAGRADLQRDCDRQNLLRTLGWKVLVFTSHDVRQRPGRTVEVIWRAISGAEPTTEVVSAPENG